MLGQPNCAIKWSRKHVRFILYAVYYFDKMFVSIEIDIILLRLIHSCAAAAFLPIMYVCFFSFPLLCSEFSSSALFTHFFIYFLKIPSIVYFHLSFWQDLIRAHTCIRLAFSEFVHAANKCTFIMISIPSQLAENSENKIWL